MYIQKNVYSEKRILRKTHTQKNIHLEKRTPPKMENPELLFQQIQRKIEEFDLRQKRPFSKDPPKSTVLRAN